MKLFCSFIDCLLVLALLMVVAALVSSPAKSQKEGVKSQYVGEKNGVEIWLVCVNGTWLTFSNKPGSDFHILAPHITGAAIGVKLPSC